jgi:hypothetical protein
MGESLFIGILAMFAGASFNCLWRIVRLAEAIRIDLWGHKIREDPLPTTVREIDQVDEARFVLSQFYAHTMYLRGWSYNGFVVTPGILFLSMVPYILKPSQNLSQETLTVMQITVIAVAAMWSAYCTRKLIAENRKRNDYLLKLGMTSTAATSAI